jgi:DNA recombination-dependent growth factor C
MARKVKQEAYQPSGDVRRIIPLNGGKNAYLLDHLGKNKHYKTNSEEFIIACREVDKILPGRVVKDLENLHWDEIAEKVRNSDEES